MLESILTFIFEVSIEEKITTIPQLTNYIEKELERLRKELKEKETN